MRELLRRDLGRSLEAHGELDRLRAAWPVACGRALAAQGTPAALEAGVLTVEVHAADWLDAFRARGAVLRQELGTIARVRLSGIHFKRTVDR